MHTISRTQQILTLLTLFVVVFLAACGPAPTPTAAPTTTLPPATLTRPSTPSMKGMELYSWQTENGQWQFALLEGTNRNKTLAEVQARPLAVEDLPREFTRLAVGEQVYWLDYTQEQDGSQINLAYPPEEIFYVVVQLATLAEVDLIAFQ